MQVARSISIARSTFASSSKSRLPLRTPSADRYLAIHAFFTRQASTITRPAPLSPLRTSLQRSKRYNSSIPPKSRASPGTEETTPGRGHAQDYAPFIQRLIRRTKTIAHDAPHRPTKEELLAAASGVWERMRIRLKWFFIRGWRRFNTDDLSAFASWFVLGNSKLQHVDENELTGSSVDPDWDNDVRFGCFRYAQLIVAARICCEVYFRLPYIRDWSQCSVSCFEYDLVR